MLVSSTVKKAKNIHLIKEFVFPEMLADRKSAMPNSLL